MFTQKVVDESLYKTATKSEGRTILKMNEISDRTRDCSSAARSSFVSAADSHFSGPNEVGSSDDRAREAPPRGPLYEVQRFISLEKAKLLALLIVLGCACNHALLRYKYGNGRGRLLQRLICFSTNANPANVILTLALLLCESLRSLPMQNRVRFCN